MFSLPPPFAHINHQHYACLWLILHAIADIISQPLRVRVRRYADQLRPLIHRSNRNRRISTLLTLGHWAISCPHPVDIIFLRRMTRPWH
ncbi:uncharacterized protein M421DRAFT_376617 [Didymella exigua CBS 183.55]|uniref:Uncharacterized protein n=1 Tax=Didymella exigua CBS 183.55 TaxID=1150837 RepID=A0A6A5RQ34_9PLEO|nr:uncharacterized protein M421DRAFT_376617 [Didymella exigua CBS 183.55]KAF1930551.1 hypothetical protein M421DRAFT_376617 [Didymella exigua CBS 183.55]